MEKIIKQYANEIAPLAGAASTTEPSYYPAIRALLADLLKEMKLPFEVRASTSERRHGGGSDMPDLALYDGAGDFVVTFCEVKLPDAEIEQMAASTDRNNQIGRYLAQTRVVLLCNVRAFGLLTADPDYQGMAPVPPAKRRLEHVVELWPSKAAMGQSKAVPADAIRELAELIETAATRCAPIAEPESLARILASQARRAKAELPEKFTDAIRGLLDDFGKALGIAFAGEEGEEFFRSSLVQTAFYGLFAGWALWHQSGEKRPFRWEDLSEYLKIPFLGELFHEFQHPRRIRELNLRKHLDIATETLRRVHASLFFQRFQLPGVRPQAGGAKAASTAIMYFYEPFLEAFDPNLRKELGVWYTPPEIVQYQVRKVDQILRQELGCARGYADERVVVLDPCCGTGAYLIEVLRCLAEQLESEGVGADFAARLLDAAHRRVMGFEILTAPFVVAQLQLYLILADLGAAPNTADRPAIFLTNALTGWDGDDQLKLNFPELQEEHDAARLVKKDARIIVILGNPPYNRFAGIPMAEEADLVDHYKGIRRDAKGKQIGQSDLFTVWKVRKHLLDDLYIRFIRLAERRIGEKADHGVVSFISNSSYLTGRSHPILRESLLRNFNALWIENLNGDKYKTGKVIPKGLPGAGTADQSVFTTEQDSRGIQVGTGIVTLLKRGAGTHSPTDGVVYIRDFWGMAAKKRKALIESTTATQRQLAKNEEKPEGPCPYEEFHPTRESGWKFIQIAHASGFEEWPGLDELFPTAYQGVNPNRGLEGSLIECDRNALQHRMTEYYSDMSEAAFTEKHPILMTPRADYDPAPVRRQLKKCSKFNPQAIVPYVVAPLDSRWIYYETEAKLLNRRRPELWENLKDNDFLISVPQPRRVSESRPLLATSLFDLHLHDRGSAGYPGEYLPEHKDDLFSQGSERKPVANLSPEAWEALKAAWGLRGNLEGTAARQLVRKLFRHALALCHAPQYEEDHKESLAQDWAHIPIPKDKSLLEESAAAGDAIAILLNPLADPSRTIKEILGEDGRHLARLMRLGGGSIRKDDLVITVSYYGGAKGKWTPREPLGDEPMLPVWGAATGDLFLNDNVYFAHVPEAAWRYELGGYPVLKKWLGYRDAKRRDGPLTLEEVDHFRSMTVRLAALFALHERLDRLYERTLEDPFDAAGLGVR